MIVF
jgi:hypothetical protein